MKFSQGFIDQVQEATNLVDIIGQHTVLKSSGRGLMGRCPFPDHQEKTPSFSVSEEKQVYHCFGCGKSGNIFTYLRDHEGMHFGEAIEFLANRARIPLPKTEFSSKDDLENQRKQNIIQANEVAARYFREQFLNSEGATHAREYALGRGLSVETLETFQVGYAPPDWSQLVEHLQSQRVPLEVAAQAHLIKAKQSGQGYFDLFRERLMFPIHNKKGDVVAFGGRVLKDGTPKYLNSPETPVFHKSKILYGLNETARYIRSEDRAIIVEGYMDLVSLYQAGVKPVVAIMGTALTDDHAHQLKNLTKNIYLLLDGDQAGMNAAERSLPILLKAGFHPKGVALPQELDPDDFVKKYGVDNLEKELAQAPDLFVLVMSRWIGNKTLGQTDKIQMIDRLSPLLSSISDRRLQDLYIKEIATRLSLEPHWIRQSLRGTSNDSGARFAHGNPNERSQASPQLGNQASSGPNGNRNSSSQTRVFASGALENLPSDSREESAKNSAAAAEENRVFRLAKAPKVELALLAYALKSRANMNFFREENALEMMSEGDPKKLFEEILNADRQTPERFDRLVSQFVNKVDQAHFLFVEEVRSDRPVEKLNEDRDDSDTGMPAMIVKRLKENYLREELKRLGHDLQAQASPEKLERLRQIQSEIALLSKSAKGAV